MKQVVVIGGGDAFPTYDAYLASLKEFHVESLDFYRTHPRWKSSLQEELGTDYDVLRVTMPNTNNARYAEWKIWFEKLIPFLEDGVVLVGHSLGAIFLAKYLAEETLPVTIASTLLISAPYDDESKESLGDFRLPDSLAHLEAQGGHIFLYHSEDDPVVPFSELAKYQAALPRATTRIFTDRAHFNQETFPELVADIKSL